MSTTGVSPPKKQTKQDLLREHAKLFLQYLKKEISSDTLTEDYNHLLKRGISHEMIVKVRGKVLEKYEAR